MRCVLTNWTICGVSFTPIICLHPSLNPMELPHSLVCRDLLLSSLKIFTSNSTLWFIWRCGWILAYSLRNTTSFSIFELAFETHWSVLINTQSHNHPHKNLPFILFQSFTFIEMSLIWCFLWWIVMLIHCGIFFLLLWWVFFLELWEDFKMEHRIQYQSCITSISQNFKHSHLPLPCHHSIYLFLITLHFKSIQSFSRHKMMNFTKLLYDFFNFFLFDCLIHNWQNWVFYIWRKNTQ